MNSKASPTAPATGPRARLATSRPWLLLVAAALWSAGAVADVTFEGLDKRQQTNARAFVQLVEAPCETPPWQLERLKARAAQQIREALEALGHYHVTVRDDHSEDKDGCWRVTYSVNPGPRVSLARVTISVSGEAEADPVFAALLADTPLVPGSSLDHGVYEDVKRRLLTTAAERGYFDATLTRHEVVVDADANRADIDIALSSGPRYRFGDVRFEADFLATSLLEKFNEIESGSYYDTTRLSATHKALLDTGYFQYVNIDADPARAVDLTIPVKIDLAPGKKRIYSGGLGFATDSGPRFRLNYRNRLINRRGHTLNGALLLSSVHSLLGTEYRIPQGDDRRDLLLLRAGVEQEDTDTSETQAFELSVRKARGRGDDWLETIFVEAQFDDFKIAGQDSTSRLIVPGINWWHLSASSLSGQRLGRSLFLELRGTSEAIGSDTSYLQAIAKARRVRSLGERSRLLTRLHLGVTAKERFSELPPSTRFFAGGDRSVRGYSYESIGPTDDNGEVIGGSHLITASVEVDWALNERWGIALFADSGAAFSADSPQFSTGVGFGLRRQSPLGPIRIDLAHPLDLDRKIRLHVSFGPDL